jgi:hypothetical protein
MTRAGGRSPFFAGVFAVTAPLMLWSFHFAFCYVAVAIGCTDIAHDGGPDSITQTQLRLLLIGGTALALGLGAWLVVRACRSAAGGFGDLLPKVRLACAALALVAMVWTALPLALLPVCSL